MAVNLNEFRCANGCGGKLYPGLASDQQEIQDWHNQECPKLQAEAASD